jgi:hypothetical protein
LGDVIIRVISYPVLVVGVPDRRTHKELVPMSRPLAALASVVLTVLGGVFLLFPQCASACSCAGVQSSQDALADSEAVFAGEVVKIDRPSPFKSSAALETDTFRVSEVWKGPGQRTLEVHTALWGASCGYPFKEGEEYLVYAYTGKQGLEVDLCGATIPLSEAGADLQVLANSEKPMGGEALSDTSGGVSAGAMVGVAGLALAASIALVLRLMRTDEA